MITERRLRGGLRYSCDALHGPAFPHRVTAQVAAWREKVPIAFRRTVHSGSQFIEKVSSTWNWWRFLGLVDQGSVSVGAHSYGAPRVYMSRNPGVGLKGRGSVRIGSFCSIASGVEILTGGNHRTDWVSTFPLNVVFGTDAAWTDGHPTSKGDVNIGNDVWIGFGAKILSGVTIGDGAVVGAASLVSRDVRPYAIVAGNPAREVRRRFSDEHVEELLRIQWWNWPADVIAERIPLLSSDRIDDFLKLWG